MERILVIYYTQSGQLKQIADNFVAPFLGAGIPVDYYEIEMETPFPFPWNNEAFFGAFPESFLQLPQPIKPVPTAIMEREYSLIICGTFHPLSRLPRFSRASRPHTCLVESLW